MIPIRDDNSETCGLYIPNFDNTLRTITERRIRSLHEISQRITRSLTQELTVQNALAGMSESNARDLQFALFYVAENADERDAGQDGDANSNSGNSGSLIAGSSLHLRSRSVDGTEYSVEEQEMRLALRLLGRYGIKEGFREDEIPLKLYSGSEETSDSSPPDCVERYIRQARETNSAVHIPDLALLPRLANLCIDNPYGDLPKGAVVIPIRSSLEDRLHGVMVVGLNTRLQWSEEYSNYVQLVAGLLATGIAANKLRAEELSRARYMVTLNRQKNEELQTLLKCKTDELKTSELKFTSAFAGCPAGIWIGSPEGAIWDVNQAYLKLAGMSENDPLDDWVHR
jgi:GAF domain-containing protein